MGLLVQGKPLSWEDSKQYAQHVREHGITQLLNLWDRVKNREGDQLLWGDEIEYMIVTFDDDSKNAKLALCQSELLPKLQMLSENIGNDPTIDAASVPTFHPEYGRYMIESTPGSPYTGSLPDLLSVEANMRYRRTLARQYMKPNQRLMTITSFPRLGVPGIFTEPYFDPVNAISSHSLFLPEEITNQHIRFPTLTANIRRRRGSKVAINLPIFPDTKVPKPFIDPTIPWDRNVYEEDSEAKNGAAHPDSIYLDAMGFGMGCCCLQITFQASSVAEAQTVYDALVPVGPIMLALTAASPAYRGYLADVDCRWNVIAGSVDDRTEEERGLKPLKNNKYVIPKSRYDSVDSYLSPNPPNRPEYTDNLFLYDEEIYKRLTDHGIDEPLAKHFAHLYIRDPLVVFSDRIDLDDAISTDHFESIQSSNWQTLRFKPPPPSSPIGWRVEFRSMEVQITDFENAAFSVFIVLLSRAILSFGLTFYMPISKVDENMQRAQKRAAVTEQKFWFRKQVYPLGVTPEHQHSTPKSQSPSGSPPPADIPLPSGGGPPLNGATRRPVFHHTPSDSRCPSPHDEDPDAEYEEMTINEVINGNGGDFPGLLGLVNAYLNSLDVGFDQKRRMRKYLELVKRRADGSLQTAATWTRDFVRSHPDYKFDSVVSQEINYDLMKAVDEIEKGTRRADALLPKDYQGSLVDDGRESLRSS
ncbi:hypothetical protein FRB94_011854 [Tulasnella sp. JGI-2019a]|nr:hypothetical protein FRB94_011854 [Tulasnella sp. JGI-2019a]KAG9014459.1 hypothetical protein FRB93_013584 [Tulasnella sp. JGI-2019a]